MTITPQLANVGLANNDHNGDPLRIAMQKYNQNFTDIYAAIQPNASIKTITVNTGITIGNASVYATVNSTLYTGSANNSLYLGGNVAAKYIQNTDSRVLSGNLSFTGSNVTFTDIGVGTNTFTANSSGVYANSLVSAYSLNVTDTANITTLNIANNAKIVGNLEVDGTLLLSGNTTFVNATVITTNDKNIILANNAVTNVDAAGAGIIIGQNANLVFNGTVGAWQSNVIFIPAVNNLGLGTASYQWNLVANNANANYIFANNKIQVGSQAGYNFGNTAVIEIDVSANSYQQIVIQNANNGTQASGDLVITADTGNDSVNYIDFGINSSTYSNATYALTGPLDAYLYSSDSKLVIGTASVKDVIVHAGGVAATNRVLTVNTTAVTVANGQTLAANVLNVTIANASNVIATNIIASYVNAAASVNAVTINATSVNASSFTATDGNVNTIVNTSVHYVGNSVANTTISANGITIFANGQGYFRMGNTTVNTTVNATAIYITNSTGTSYLSATVINTTGAVNATSFTATDGNVNTVVNTSVYYVGNSVANTTISANGITISANGQGYFRMGNSSVNSSVNVTSVYVSNSSGTSYLNPTTINVGNSSVNSSVNSTSFYSGVTGTGTGGLVANSTLIFVGNNTVNAYLNTTGLNVNAVTIANTTGVYTGTVNAASLTVGTSFIANTTGVYHTGTVNAASLTVGGAEVVNSTGIYTTGTINAASLTVGGAEVVNALGVYTTGTVNAASHTIGTTFIANTSAITFTPNTFTLGTSTTTANGYTYLPNGLKMNYGFVAANSTVGNVTFSSAYTTAAYVVMLTSANTVAAANVPYISSQNTTVAVIRSASVAAATTIYYLAIGI